MREWKREIRVGLPVILKEYVTGYRPAVRLLRMLERDGWGAAAERPEVCDAGELNKWKNAEFGIEEESEQKSEQEDGRSDLLPEMDRADPLRSRPRLRPGFRSTSDRSRTGEQRPEETA